MSLFQLLPKIDEFLEDEKIIELIKNNSRKLVLDAIRNHLNVLREDIKQGISEDELKSKIDKSNELVERILERNKVHSLKKVINGVGVVLHTNLGRAALTEEILDELAKVSIGYSNLEYDIEKGERGSRYTHLERILKEITGAEAAMVVNNNASAVMLILSELAKGREVITSRGELIEIGGAFRIPDVCAQSGARLVEVGTTNKTHLSDYQRAITEDTAAILKVHTSNYKVVGFTESVKASDMLDLKENGLYIIEDLGSGVLIDLSKYGITYEPTVQDSIKSGVDVVSFSGDKLLGGPQAGIIVGKKEIIDRLKKHPLTRALRVDKFTISALETVLRYYEDEEIAIKKVPTLRMLTISQDELKEKAEKLKKTIENKSNIKVSITQMDSEVGGGSLPLEKLPSFGLALTSSKYSAQRLEEILREYQVPIISRIIKEECVLDIRCIFEDEFEIVADALSEIGD